MNLHEYQAKQLLASNGVPVAEGIMVESVMMLWKQLVRYRRAPEPGLGGQSSDSCRWAW